MRRLIAAAVTMALTAPGPASACAVPTQMALHNETSRLLRAFYIDDTDDRPRRQSTANRLPPAGLAPGATTTITFPSCMGIYVLRAVFADGSEQTHPDIDARRIRALSLR